MGPNGSPNHLSSNVSHRPDSGDTCDADGNPKQKRFFGAGKHSIGVQLQNPILEHHRSKNLIAGLRLGSTPDEAERGVNLRPIWWRIDPPLDERVSGQLAVEMLSGAVELVDSALRLVRSRSKSKSGNEILGPVMFKDWVLELYTDAVLSGAGKALLLRVTFGVAGIIEIETVTHAGGQVVGTAVGAHSLGVAVSIFLALSA
ncbi:hypothetical protein PIB30_068695 [Stylosanthes scabra]|uniref:Uncharacterized protein n=1 Tax=Stylosanthes scabra TaxID=79078 RepID=A0ABU6RMZ4_9FABA|nr:hypothetical protein [Stylosanthes scabra]